MSRVRGWRALAGVALATMALVAQAASTDQRQRNERITLYYGVVPAALAQPALAPHAPAPDPHGSPRPAADTHHLVVALFDNATGKRITQANVSVRYVPPRGRAISKALVPMPLGDVLSFGTTFVIPEGRGHRFVIEVHRGDIVDRFEVEYDNLHGAP